MSTVPTTKTPATGGASTREFPIRVRMTPSQKQALGGAVGLLQKLGMHDDVAVAMTPVSAVPPPPSVVVVGEVKRGKSTLVNALTGTDVSPTAAEVITTGVIAVVPPSDDLPAGTARVELADGSHRDAPREEALASLAVEADPRDAGHAGVPVTEPATTGDGAPPVGVRIAVESRWLPGVTVFDTPGVGGLRAVHGRRARAAVQHASLMLFVSDGGQVLTAPELDFVREVAAGSASVVFVLSRTDRNPTTWEAVLAENRQLLQTHAPRLADAPIVPVAATFAVQAAAHPEAVAAKLLEASGMARLAEVVTERVGDASRARIVHALEGCADGLGAALEVAERDVALLEGADPDVVDAMVTERERLAELRHDLRTSRLELERDLGRVRHATLDVLNKGADDVVTRISATISKRRGAGSKGAQQQFAANLEAELAVLVEHVRRVLDAGVKRVVADAFGSLDARPQGRFAAPIRLGGGLSRVRTRTAATTSSKFDPSVATTAFLGANVAALVGLGGPIGILIAGGWLTLNIGFRGMREGQQQLNAILNDNVNTLRRELTTSVDAVIREVRPELYVAMEDHLKSCIGELDGMIKASEAQSARSQAEQEQARAEARRRRDTVAARRATVLEELEALRRERAELT
ncbi:dynamin family protein [Nocardioides zeae]|uniref:Dynamin family protein n=1 Tax=Nocardioides imazamoxiresistens TaxID=3231893 RepID=A0ABU3Q0J7_9ACTN|nr:dynamin family protein [Nocardioides zeae]MDT9595040.1 dynamin family protein [Nocardioides zeae]